MAIILGLDETCNGYVLAMEEDSSLKICCGHCCSSLNKDKVNSNQNFFSLTKIYVEFYMIKQNHHVL